MKRTLNQRLTVLGSILLLTLTAWSQEFQIKGKVLDKESNQALEAATINVSGSRATTRTNASGEFSLLLNKPGKIVVSFVGYTTQTVDISRENASPLVLLVRDLTSQLSDVVVTGLGVRRETKKLGYAVQEVKGEDLVKAREANPVNSLVGKVSGLDVAINKELLAAPNVSLRGYNISLYVVDGIPITSDTWNISPDDIETYTILKGLAATAIYGSRAQNGAILITTKKAKRSKKGYTIEYNSSTQLDKGFIALPQTQTLYGGGDYSQYSFGDGKGGGVNDGDYDVWGPALNGQLIPQWNSPIDPNTGKRTATPYLPVGVDNLKRFIRPGLLNTNNLSFATATDRSSLRMSLSNSHQTGIIPNTKLDIVNFNMNASTNLSDKFRVEGNLNFNHQFTPNIPDVLYGPNSVIYSVTVWTGADWNIEDMRDYWQPGKVGVQSKFAEYQRYHNPYFMSYEWLRGHYKNDVTGYVALSYKPFKDFEATLRTNVTSYNVLRTEKMPYSAHPYGRELNRGDYREDARELFDNNVEALGKYNHKFGKIVVDAIGGLNARNFSYRSSFTTTDYLNVPGLYSFANSLNAIRAYNYQSKMVVLSGYYTVGVELGKYLNLTTTGRVDKSSTLLPGKNTYFYPSFSAATVLSDYIHLPNAISFLKFRASYASAKSPNTQSYIGPAAYPIGYGSPYVTVYGGPSYSLSDPAYSIGTVYNNQIGASAPLNAIDSNIKSSSTTSIEYGFDMKFLRNRIGISATYFNNILGPGIRNFPISQTTGITGFTTNAIKTQVKGAEVSLSGAALRNANGLNWDILVNWSTFVETYKDLPESFSSYQFKQGDRVDKLYARVTAKTAEGQVINNSAGYPVYLPKNQYVGNADSKFGWAVYNKFSYKNFSFSFQFDGKVGGVGQDRVMRKGIEGGSNIFTVQGEVGKARAYEAANYNKPDFKGSYVGEGVQISNGVQIQYDPVTGVITNLKDLQFTNNTSVVKYIQDYVSSFFNDFEHTSVSKTYAKLREIVFTYSLPQNVFGSRSPFSKVDISLVGRNLLYFFPERFKDMDVDQYMGRTYTSGNSREYDLQTPTTRSYGINVNLTF
jgi:TonB-linked SusC/RagA family outer membrane protein